MGLSTLFGGDASARQRQARGLKQIRHNGRTQRLSLGRQLRTLMCFTTEEKLSRGGSGDKQRRAKSGSLSQRLRLSESCEEQGSGGSQLEALSGLTVRPSTCPPPHATEQQPLTDPPSSFTLSSLNEEQLNSYLSVLLNRCARDEQSKATECKSIPGVTEAVIESGERLGKSPSSVADSAVTETLSAAPTEVHKPVRRPTRRECEELIRRHEQLFGPIVTSRPAPLRHELPELCQPPLRHELPELCQPPPASDAAYLSIPRHQDVQSADAEWDAWRPHFSAGTDGVWRIIGDDSAAAECPPLPAASEEAPAGPAATRRHSLFGSLRSRCTALFRHQQRGRTPDPTPADDASIEPDTNADSCEQIADVIEEKVLSELKSADLLKDMKDAEVTPCTSCEAPSAPAEVPRPDPRAYRGGAYHPWGRYFGHGEGTQNASQADEPTKQDETDHSGVEAAPVAPALWWGVSPPVESSPQPQPGGPSVPAERLDRQALWLSRPELPQLFTAAGLGPDDMTRWLLSVPHEREDDAVPLASADPDRHRAAAPLTGTSPREPLDHEATPQTTPRAKFFEELMGTPPAELSVESSADICDEPGGSPAPADGIVLQQTSTADIATPATQFADGWGGTSEAVPSDTDQSRSGQGLTSIALGAPAGAQMPLCSDVCTFLLPEHRDSVRAASPVGAAAAARDAKQPYETYGTDLWSRLGARRPARRHRPASTDGGSPHSQPVGKFDSETELGAHLSEPSGARPSADCHQTQLRNSSVRPIDSEVDIAQVLHEQSGYATLGETATVASGGYQALPLHEVDSETELGLALPLTDSERPLSAARHRQVTAYDSETEVAALAASLHATDSETEMAERLRRLSAGGAVPPPPEQRRGASPSDSMTRLPAGPVQVDSETEMGVVLRLFEQGMLPSRYFAGVPLVDEFQSSDLQSSPEAEEKAGERALDDPVSLPMPIDDIYNSSKQLSRKVIRKALFLLGCEPPVRPVIRTGSSPFGPSVGLEDTELEREAAAADTDRPSPLPEGDGTCDPQRVIPEVRLTTSDGSLVVLFPSRPADTADTSHYETDEGLVLRLQQRTPQPAAESRGFQPTEAGLSHSERELSTSRRLVAERCADAALRRRSPSPRACSDDGGLHVLYRADGAEPWQPVSPEGLSGLSLTPTDPELAALRWRKSSRGEDGDPEAWSAGGEAAPPPPAESQSQTELRKGKAEPPSGVGGANSWC